MLHWPRSYAIRALFSFWQPCNRTPFSGLCVREGTAKTCNLLLHQLQFYPKSRQTILIVVLLIGHGDSNHHRPTPVRTRLKSPFCFLESRLMRHSSHEGECAGADQPRQLCYLGYAAPLTASAVGDRSLMWVCHITGTPGCSTANVLIRHSLG